MKKLILCCLIFVCSLSVATSAQALIIAEVTGDAMSVWTNDAIVLSWTQAQTYSDVSISVALSSLNLSSLDPGGGTIWLTDQVGPGTTTANVISQANFSNIPVASFGSPVQLTPAFSGLTLPADTYYLVLNRDEIGWVIPANPPNVSTAPGVTTSWLLSFAADYPFTPSSNMVSAQYVGAYSITGNAVPVPEPATILLLGSGLLGLLGFRKKFKK